MEKKIKVVNIVNIKNVLPVTGSDVSSPDHHPSRTPAVSRSPLRHGSHYAALQRAPSPLRNSLCCSQNQTFFSDANSPAAALCRAGTQKPVSLFKRMNVRSRKYV